MTRVLESISDLQIVGWNFEHLSGQPRAQRRQSAFALADHIEMAGIDIIALQRVYVTPASDLNLVCFLLDEHLDTPWKCEILPNVKPGDKSQLCAVLWNTKRLSLKKLQPLDVLHKVGDLSLWDRKPHLLEFTSDISVWRKDASGNWDKPLKSAPSP